MEHSGVGFDDPTHVDPLSAILNDLAQELDGDPSTFQELLHRSLPILGPGNIANINNASDYFTCVQNNYDILDMVDHLFNLMEFLEYHTAMGTNRVSDQLNQYKQDLLQYREMLRMKGIDTDKNFVGRIEVLKQIYDVLADEYHPCRGVCICGLGGMGKTSLANEVCYQLLNSKASWKIIRIDLRERDSLLDLLSLTLGELQETFSSTDIRDMENKIWKAVENIKRRTILFYDNIDGLLQRKNNREIPRILHFFDEFLQKLANTKSERQVKILITSRQKLIPEEKLMEGMRRISPSQNRLGDLVLEIELGPLDVSEAVDLYLKCVDEQHRQKSKIVGEIVQYCGLCPLAIRSTCSTIRSGLIEPQVIRYNLKIGSEKGGLTNALQVNNCLKETFSSLKEDYQKKLIRLTVFKTAKFDEQAACMVLGETTMAHTLNDLLAMKTRHFVEIVDAEEYSQKVKGSSTIDNVYVKRQLRYSLHPLVYMFLQEVIKGGKFKEEIKLAKPGFVQHFEDLFLKIGKQMDKNCMKAWKMIEENRKHLISLFLDDSIDTSPRDDMKNRILLCTQKVLIGNLLMGDFHRVNFIDRMIRNSRVNGNQLELMFWKIERASWLYDLDRNELVIRQLIEVQNMMDGTVGKGVAMAPVFGCFYYLKAKLSLRKQQPEQALEDIFMAHKLFNEHRFVRHNYLYHITTIYEKIGQAYMMLEPPDLKNALLYFSAAFMKASENVENFNNLDIPGSIASMGRCWYEEGLQEKANGNKIVAKLLFQKSVAYYTKAMALDTQMNLHKIDNYADKLIKRAESYVELGLLKVSGALSDAVKDIKEADMLRRKILQPPSYKSTHTPHLVGRILLIKAKQEYENKQKMTAINNLWEGVLYYEITRDMIKSGGLHPLQLHMTEYQEIIQEHLWALQQTRDVDKIPEAIKFYNDLNAGKFAEDMKRARSEKETKKNSEYIPIEDVEAEIMMSGPGQLTVAPTTEETEVEEEDFDNETMEKICLEHYELKLDDRMNFDKLFARMDDPDHPELHPISDEEVSNADDESMEVTGAGNVVDITADMGKIISKSDMVGITEENHDEVFNPENESKDETGNELLSTVRRKSSGGRRLSSSDGEASIKAKRRHFRRKRGSRDASMQKFLDDLDELTSEKARGILKSSKSASKDESFEMEMPVMDYLTIVDTTDKEEKKGILKKMKQIYSSVQEEQEEDIAEDDETIPPYQEEKVLTGKKRHGVESESTQEASHAKSSRDVN